jgi:hypothetical protein
MRLKNIIVNERKIKRHSRLNSSSNLAKLSRTIGATKPVYNSGGTRRAFLNNYANSPSPLIDKQAADDESRM